MNIYGDVVGGEESFYIPAGDFCAASGEGKKPQKLLMIPGGSFGGSPVGVSPELRIPASVASPTPLPHTALLATASQQSDLFSSFFLYLEGKVQQCGRSSIQGFSSLECCTMSKIMF